MWTTRLWNIWRDDARDIPFKVVHTVLAVISVAFAIAGLAIVSRGRRTAAVSDPLDVVATAPARVDAVRVL